MRPLLLALAAASLLAALPLSLSAKDAEKVSLEIVSPKMGETVAGPDVPVTFILKNYEVYFDSTRGKGQHIHFILDNEPYVPLYSAKPYTAKGLAPGTHTIRAFPSREWHESIKDEHAFAMVTFNVDKADGQNALDPKKPLLTYSRPKGEYAGHAADSIMVDFWVKNAKLGKDDYKVLLTVDGKSEVLAEWKPIWKTKLGIGQHTFKLELVDPKGQTAPGPFNVTERTITLKGAAPDTSQHAH